MAADLEDGLYRGQIRSGDKIKDVPVMVDMFAGTWIAFRRIPEDLVPRLAATCVKISAEEFTNLLASYKKTHTPEK